MHKEREISIELLIKNTIKTILNVKYTNDLLTSCMEKINKHYSDCVLGDLIDMLIEDLEKSLGLVRNVEKITLEDGETIFMESDGFSICFFEDEEWQWDGQPDTLDNIINIIYMDIIKSLEDEDNEN